MKIHKPDDVLILLGYQARGGQNSLVVTLGYAIDADQTPISEQDTWQWLLPLFPAEPFDTALKKQRRGFGVAGDAMAPQGTPVDAMAVRARVGDIEKTLHVHGQRRWVSGTLGYKASPAQPFTRMPLDLSHAFGGKDYAPNPHGMGLVTPADGAPLPCVELPGAPMLSPGDTPEPATFGPLPQGSPARTRFLGRFDTNWQRERFPWLPDDTDPRWFDAFAQDQCRDGYWRGDEAWSVQGMHATHAEVQGRLPGLRPRLLIRQGAQPDALTREATLELDTVWLFPNTARTLVLYRAQIPVSSEDASDIAALGVFTETLAEPAHSTAHWDAVWQAQDAPAPPPVEPAPLAQPQAEADAMRAQAQAQMAAMADSLWQTLEASHADALAQAASQMKAHGLAFEPAQYAFPARTDLLPSASRAPRAPLSPTFAADLQRDIDASLAGARQEAEQTLRRVANEAGHDGDALVRLARNPPPQPEVSVRQQIEQAALPAADKKLALARLTDFEQEMATLDARIAQLDGDIAALHARTAAAAGVQAGASAQQTVQGALADAGVHGRERQTLDREALRLRHAQGLPLDWLQLEDLDLTDASWSGTNWSHSILKRCRLDGVVLTEACFDHANLEDCTFDRAELSGATFRDALINGGSASSATASAVNLAGAQITGMALSAANLTGAVLTRATLTECLVAQAVMTDAQAAGTQWRACDFTRVRADGAHFAGARLEGCVLEHAGFVRADFAGATVAAARGARTDFAHADLRGLRMDSACALHAPRFTQANLSDASLQDSSLVAANFHQTDLSRAFIKNCDLSQSDGWRAHAPRSDFHGSRLSGASWVAANFMEASLYKTVLEDLDLSGANLHAAQTRTAQVRGIRLDGALLTRCRLLEEHASD